MIIVLRKAACWELLLYDNRVNLNNSYTNLEYVSRNFGLLLIENRVIRAKMQC